MKQPGDELVIQETIAHCCFVSLKKQPLLFLDGINDFKI